MIADLQNQQAATTAQNPALILVSIPTPISIPKPLKVYIAKSPDFDGNDYNTFKWVIGFYLLAAY